MLPFLQTLQKFSKTLAEEKALHIEVKLLTRLSEYVSTPFMFSGLYLRSVKGQNYCDLYIVTILFSRQKSQNL